jgi:nucleotide-binding universal stress UspA family protein
MLEGELSTCLIAQGRRPESISHIVKEGPARDVIDEEVRLRKPDLLVLGAHVKSARAEVSLGSVAMAFLSCPPCDVLLEPTGHYFQDS